MRILILFFSLMPILTLAQRERLQYLQGIDDNKWGWGYSIGLSHFDFKVTPNKNGIKNDRFTVYASPSWGFAAGLMGKLRMGNHLDLRLEPTMHFVKRKLYFHHLKLPDQNKRDINSTYLDIPLMLYFHGERTGNIRPYIAAGPSYALNLTAGQKSTDDNSRGNYRLKTHNFTWQAEAGIAIYLPYFKVTPSVKGIFFINNESVKDNPNTPPNWAGSIDRLQTRAFVISLKFE